MTLANWLAGLGIALGGLAMAGQAETYGDLAGLYRLAEMDGRPVAVRVVLEIAETGIWRGEGPCNRFGFTQSAAFPAFRAGAIRGTKRACADLGVENAVIAALQKATGAAFEDGRLTLSGTGTAALVFLRDSR